MNAANEYRQLILANLNILKDAVESAFSMDELEELDNLVKWQEFFESAYYTYSNHLATSKDGKLDFGDKK